MKISYNWLKQYIDIDLEQEELSILLTNCGLEVEGLEKWQSLYNGLENVVVAEVLTCEKMPDSDHLSITTVNAGDGSVYPVVCGAPNVAAGQKVILAKPGAKLLFGEKEIEIKKTKIRGHESQGMICAEDEIGVGTSHEGIMVLEKNLVPGTPAADFFGYEEDVVFEIGLTPNRTDAMSHIGVARDIIATLKNSPDFEKLDYQGELNIPGIEGFQPDNHDLEIPVIVEDPLACPRYTGVSITNIKVSESPKWLKNRLIAIGLRPINNIVDITNYVLHETGQPLHAFDAEEITGNKVIVKKLPEKTKFTTLDEIERELSADDLMICNSESGMCIGGVFGGIRSGVTEKTTSIFLESAYFDPVSIRKTSKLHDLQTDASFRFERGVDPEMTLYALKRAALLMKEIAGGMISSDVKDVYPEIIMNAVVDIDLPRIFRLTGKNLGKEKIKSILLSLDFKVLKENENNMTLEIPSNRVDVLREADVAEEIMRIYGYNNIEIPAKINASLSPGVRPDRSKLQTLISTFLSGNGFYEMINNSLSRHDYYTENQAFADNKTVQVLNPLSRDLGMMRRTLLYGALETIMFNINRKNPDLRLFEFGKSYMLTGKKSNEIPDMFSETNLLALALTGNTQKENWTRETEGFNFFHLKEYTETVLKKLNISPDTMTTDDNIPEFFEYGISFLWNNTRIITAGRISDRLLRKSEIEQEVYYSEMNWDALLEMTARRKTSYSELPRFPAVRRDIALLLDKSVAYKTVKELAFNTERKLLKEVGLFDVYQGKNIEAGKISYAVSFILQDTEKTLTDKVIEKTMERLRAAFVKELDARIR